MSYLHISTREVFVGKHTETTKTNSPFAKFSLLAVALAVLALACAEPAGAATYTWDATSGNSTIEEGAGTWSVGGANWDNGTSYDQVWADGNDAVFGGGASGTAGTVTVSGTVTPTSMTLRKPFSGNYTFAGGTISLGTGGMPDSTATYASEGKTTINSDITLTGNQTWDYAPSDTSLTTGPRNEMALNGVITGDFTLTLRTKVGYHSSVPNQNTVTLSSTGNSLLGLLPANCLKVVLDNSVAASPSLTLGATGLKMTASSGNPIVDINNATLTINSSGPLEVGTGNNGNGTMTIRGTSTVTLNGGDIKVGDNNTNAKGILDFWDSPTVTANNLTIAHIASTGFVNLHNTANVTVSGNILVVFTDANSVNGAQGVLTVADSATLSGDTMTVGDAIGAAKAQFGQFYQRGGTVTITNDIKLCNGTFANGTNNGTLNLAGGTLKTGGRVYTPVVAATSLAMVNFHGGTLAYTGTGDQTDFLNLTNANGKAHIYEGATINDGGKNLTIAQALLAPTGSGVTAITLGSPNTSSNYFVPPAVRITGTGSGATAIAQVDASSGAITNILITNPGQDYTGTPTAILEFGGAAGNNQPTATVTTTANAYTGGLTKTGAGTLTLTGANTYTGDTSVSNGTLALASAGSLKFFPAANGTCNKITGAGTATLNGKFNIDLTGAAIANGNSWTLVDVTTKTYHATSFGMVASGWSETSDVWTNVDGTNTWTFTEATGVLALTVYHTLYADTLAGSGSALNGSVADTTVTFAGGTAGATWTADGDMTQAADGTTYGGETAGQTGDNAWLPFTPQPGYIYTLTATGTASGDWWSLSFVEVPNGFMILNGPGAGALCRGDGGGGPQFFVANGDNSSYSYDWGTTNLTGTQTLTIVLDTRGALWTTSASIGSETTGIVRFTSNPTNITAVGFGTDLGPNLVTNFSLTAVAGATTYAVLYDGNTSDSGSVVDTTPYANSATVTVLGTNNLVKEGHTFEGWNTQAGGAGDAYAPNDTFSITADTTLYAQWAPNPSAYCITAASLTPAPGEGDMLTLKLVDQFTNIITTFNGDKNLTFSGLAVAHNGTTHPTITDKTGAAVNLGTATTITFTNGQSSLGGSLIAYRAEGPVTLAATDGTLSTATPGGAGVSLTISNAAPVAVTDSATRARGASLKILRTTLLSNDTDANQDPLTLVSVASSSTNGATIMTNATYVYYLPPATNPNVADRITYTVTDGTEESTGYVLVSILDPTGQSQNIEIGLDGSSPRLTVFGIPGYEYDIERGANTIGPWTFRTNATLPTSGVSIGRIEWTDVEVTNGIYFYRTKLH